MSTEVVGPEWMLGGPRQPERSGWVDAAVVAFICPVHQLIALEPQQDLPLGPLHRVTGMDDIPVTGSRDKVQASMCTLGVLGMVC